MYVLGQICTKISFNLAAARVTSKDLKGVFFSSFHKKIVFIGWIKMCQQIDWAADRWVAYKYV
jgi:hypothetical protein